MRFTCALPKLQIGSANFEHEILNLVPESSQLFQTVDIGTDDGFAVSIPTSVPFSPGPAWGKRL